MEGFRGKVNKPRDELKTNQNGKGESDKRFAVLTGRYLTAVAEIIEVC